MNAPNYFRTMLFVFAASIAFMSAQVLANQAITHYTAAIYSAYDGDTQGHARLWAGYMPAPSDAASYPGALVIDPGASNWSNYISAAQASVPYSIRNMSLAKQSPATMTCSDIFPGKTTTQQGSTYIRLNWPLEYEVAGTTWTLTITYGTSIAWDDDGSGPNLASYNHTEIWKWELQSDPDHLGSLVSLFHDVAVGASGVPAISDETLYAYLAGNVEQATSAFEAGDTAAVSMILGDSEWEIMDSCIGDTPQYPNPTGMGSGILMTAENPACCKLLTDIEYIMMHIGIGSPPSPRVDLAREATQNESVGHSMSTHSAFMGDSAGNPVAFRGFLPPVTGPVAMPGVLGIVPGDNWSNFIAAARSGVTYTLGDVVLTKQTPEEVNCSGVFGAATIVQSGSENIRLWWPLMYEVSGTTFTLELNYQTETPQRFAGEKSASTQHKETWRWQVNDDLESLGSVSKLFHKLSFGTSGAPLLCDEPLYGDLDGRLSQAQTALAGGDLPALQDAVGEFGVAVLDGCIAAMPPYPYPTGPELGVANTDESPAGCRLLIGSASIATSSKSDISEIVRDAPDGAAVALTEPKTVTLVQPGFFYSQDEKRTSGLKVIGAVEGLQPGGTVMLRGVMGTQGSERVLRLAGYQLQSASGPLPGSLGMPNRIVGGSGHGNLPGFLDGTGVSNGGLRVTVTGLVKSVGSDYFCIDDGSGVPSPGLRIVLLPGVNPPLADSYVRVTGVSAWFDSLGLAEPAVLVGANTDVATVP